MHIQESRRRLRHPARPAPERAGAAALRRGVPQPGRDHRRDRDGAHDTTVADASASSASARAVQRRAGRDATATRTQQPRKGFFTDTSVCIGCKACEVACKEWNGVPEDGLDLLRHVLRQHRRGSAPTPGDTSRSSSSAPAGRAGHGDAGATAARRGRRSTGGTVTLGEAALADGVGRVQALHARRLPGRLPDRVAVPHRVRHRGGAGRHLQRLRLLRPGLPVRGDRPAARSDGRAEVHAVLRPARRGHEAGLRQGVPDPVDPVRDARRAARAGRSPGSTSCTTRAWPTPGSTARTRTTGSAATGAFFLLLDEPEVYGLPPDPVVTTRDLPAMWRHAGAAALTLLAPRRRRGCARRALARGTR